LHLNPFFRACLALRFNLLFTKFQIFFLLKLSAVCTFWIVLMCWCQKWFFKNKKTSLACISARKVIWKATTTTLSNTLLVSPLCMLCLQWWWHRFHYHLSESSWNKVAQIKHQDYIPISLSCLTSQLHSPTVDLQEWKVNASLDFDKGKHL